MCIGEPVGCSLIDLQSCVFDQLRRAERRRADRYDLVVVAVNNQRRHIKPFEVFSEIRFGGPGLMLDFFVQNLLGHISGSVVFSGSQIADALFIDGYGRCAGGVLHRIL
jgi:hypothetical protein